ncbi:uncharacterized protein ACBT57_015751 [Dama dama]
MRGLTAVCHVFTQGCLYKKSSSSFSLLSISGPQIQPQPNSNAQLCNSCFRLPGSTLRLSLSPQGGAAPRSHFIISFGRLDSHDKEGLIDSGPSTTTVSQGFPNLQERGHLAVRELNPDGSRTQDSSQLVLINRYASDVFVATTSLQMRRSRKTIPIRHSRKLKLSEELRGQMANLQAY